MEDLSAAVIAAAIGAVSGLMTNVIGGFYLARLKENKAKRMEIMLRRTDNQIGKFYAPLLNFVEQLNTIANLKDKLSTDDPRQSSYISKFMYDEYFLPIHKKVALIIEANSHLLDGKGIPESFKSYNEHVASERVFFSLVDNERVNAEFHPAPYPEKFFSDIYNGFNKTNDLQEDLLRKLAQT